MRAGAPALGAPALSVDVQVSLLTLLDDFVVLKSALGTASAMA